MPKALIPPLLLGLILFIALLSFTGNALGATGSQKQTCAAALQLLEVVRDHLQKDNEEAAYALMSMHGATDFELDAETSFDWAVAQADAYEPFEPTESIRILTAALAELKAPGSHKAAEIHPYSVATVQAQLARLHKKLFQFEAAEAVLKDAVTEFPIFWLVREYSAFYLDWFAYLKKKEMPAPTQLLEEARDVLKNSRPPSGPWVPWVQDELSRISAFIRNPDSILSADSETENRLRLERANKAIRHHATRQLWRFFETGENFIRSMDRFYRPDGVLKDELDETSLSLFRTLIGFKKDRQERKKSRGVLPKAAAQPQVVYDLSKPDFGAQVAEAFRIEDPETLLDIDENYNLNAARAYIERHLVAAWQSEIQNFQMTLRGESAKSLNAIGTYFNHLISKTRQIEFDKTIKNPVAPGIALAHYADLRSALDSWTPATAACQTLKKSFLSKLDLYKAHCRMTIEQKPSASPQDLKSIHANASGKWRWEISDYLSEFFLAHGDSVSARQWLETAKNDLQAWTTSSETPQSLSESDAFFLSAESSATEQLYEYRLKQLNES